MASKAKEEFWRVVRQDSNGVQVIEADRLDEETARRYAERRTREIGFHKQTVWHERTPAPEPRNGPAP